MPIATEDFKFYYAADYLLSLRDFCFDNHLDFMKALIEAGESIELILNPPSYISFNLFKKICGNIDEIVSRPSLMGQKFGRYLASKNAHGRLGLAMRNAPDIYQTLALLEQFGETRTNTLSYSVYEDDDFINCFVEPNEGLEPFVENTVRRFLIATSIFNIFYFVKSAIDSNIEGVDFHLLFEENLDDIDLFDAGQSAHIRQNGSVNAVRIPRTIGHSKIQFSNQGQFQELRSLLKKERATGPSEGITEHAKHVVRHVGWNNISIERIASELNMSVSTLQRRLRQEGTSFKEIKNEVRIGCAKHYLMFSSSTLEFIAEKLGYSNSSNFSKSFKSAAGLPPVDFRKRYQIGQVVK